MGEESSSRDDTDTSDDTDPGSDTTSGADRPADLPPGFDEEDPYADGLDGYPDWWRENVEAFRDHGMRPYRPPQFADGTLVPELVARLESELGVELEVRKHIGVDAETAWTLVVDGSAIETLERLRNEEGRSVYARSSGEFEALVRDAAAE